MASSQVDEGFEALFKPIQDLARNWEVDLSLHLEEYINYIRQICGDNLPDMNFAQAAVLIQNSANIYGKKVDLLFTTVLQLLNTLCKKQNEAKNTDSEEAAPEQVSGKRRKAVAVLETEEFLPLNKVCSDRTLTLNLAKEKQKMADRKKPKIVLNAAIKVKPKDKTSCNVYHCGQDVMGKKEEFRLNWRICSAGTLHEEFVINRNRFKSMDPLVTSRLANDNIPDDNTFNDDDHCSHHSGDVSQLPPDDEQQPLSTSLFPTAPIDGENGEETLVRLNQIRNENLIPNSNIVEKKEIEWQPNDFNANLTDKPIKKRKVIKIPPDLEDEKKRKNIKNSVLTYTITDGLFDTYKNLSFNRDVDFCYQSKCAIKHKRLLLLHHRTKYQEYLEKEAGLEQCDDFHGFYNPEHDSDHENDFEGFGDGHDDDDDDDGAAEGNVLISDDHQAGETGWKGDDVNNYDNEAMRTMQAYRTRKIDHGMMTDMARRVEEWHQRITPKLEAAEERSSFDIHAYGSKVLDAFSEEIGCVKPFEEIVAGESREEVARYFLATLVLANQYNVEVIESKPGDLNVDCVTLKLLSVARHHEELGDNLRQTSDK